MHRVKRTLLVAIVGIVTSASYGSASAAPRRVLTLRMAERAIDLAWQAELAGDAKSARAELGQLIETSTRADESAAKERIGEWLRMLDQRESALQGQARSARAYHDAFVTLKNFGLHRSDLLWVRALKDVPALSAMTSSATVHLDVDIVQMPLSGIDRAFVEKTVRDQLAKVGLQVVERRVNARYEARVSLDATDIVDQGRNVRVTSGVSMVIRERATRQAQSRVIASVSKHRSEARRSPGDARRIASKLAVDDTVDGIAFQVRAQWLDDAVLRETAKG
jgi:hypothetical protein